jgi:hypothetical protein
MEKNQQKSANIGRHRRAKTAINYEEFSNTDTHIFDSYCGKVTDFPYWRQAKLLSSPEEDDKKLEAHSQPHVQ